MLQSAATGHPGIGTIHAPDTQAALKNLERMACESGAPAAIVRGMLTSSAVPLLVAHIGRYCGRRLVGQDRGGYGHGRRRADRRQVHHQPAVQLQPAARRLERTYPVQGDWGARELLGAIPFK